MAVRPFYEKKRSLLGDFRSRFEPGLKLYYISRWVNARYTSKSKIIVVGGCDRSGTTLLRASLDSHPMIAAGPESWVFVYKLRLGVLSQDYDIPVELLDKIRKTSSGLAQFIDLFRGEYCKRQGKPIWCEKSPRNIMRLGYIWRHFPEARVIHIIRDGRDVSCSLRNHPRQYLVGESYVPTNINRPISQCIDWWVRYVSAGIAHRGDDRYLEIRYEDLVRDHEKTTKRICKHCGVEWDSSILEREQIQSQRNDKEIVNPEVRKPLYVSAIGRWRINLDEDEKKIIEKRAGKLLRQLGYDQ